MDQCCYNSHYEDSFVLSLARLLLLFVVDDNLLLRNTHRVVDAQKNLGMVGHMSLGQPHQ